MNFSRFTQKSNAWKVSLFRVFLFRIFPHSDWIRRDTPNSVRMRENLRISPYSVQMRENTPYLSVFSPNMGKYGPEKLWIRTLFTQLVFVIKLVLKVVKKQVVKLVKKLVQLRSWYFFLFFLTYYFGDTHLLMCIKPILFVCIFVIICRFFQITPAWYTL